MPQIELTPHLARHVDCPPEAVSGATVRDVLEAYFAKHPGVNHPKRKAWFGGGSDLPSIHSICLPRDAGSTMVGVSCGGVWRSEDDGATWSLSADGMFAAYMPPALANDPSIQDPLWVSDDAGDAWTCLSSHLPPIYAVRFAG